MNAICLITFRPNEIWCKFLNLFSNYNIFIIVDDDNFDLTYFINKYTNLKFIKIDYSKCDLYGYKDVNFTINKVISGWDKALYYFGMENKIYDFVWFMEDDVLFYNENTIIQLDNQFRNEDLLSSSYDTNKNGDKKDWHWDRINISYTPPYFKGMMCVVRMSKKMIECINNYAIKNRTLFFLEALFPTVAIKNNLNYKTPNEFSKIYYRHYFKGEIVNKNMFYHPVKNLKNHISFRRL